MIKSTIIENRWRLLAASLLSAIAACLNIVLLDYLHGVAQQAEARPLLAWLPAYFGGVAMLFAFSLLANMVLVFLACRVVAQMRHTLTQKILASRYADLERTGKGPLLACLTDDIENMSEGMVVGPQFLFNVVTIILCLAYLFHLSAQAFAYFFFALCFGISLTIFIVSRGNVYLARYRSMKDRYYSHLHAMFDGAKELAIDSARRKYFFDNELAPAIAQLQAAELKREAFWNIGETWTRIFLFIALGIAVVTTRSVAQESVALTMSYFIAITFIAGPIEAVVHSVSSLAKAVYSSRLIAALQFSDRPADTAPPLAPHWQALHFEALCHTSHGAAQDEAFQLGPVSLSIRRGEIVFLTGGNGSGKSTFGKLMVGLLQRSSGQIRLDEQLIAAEPGDAYCALFASIFSDYHLFPSLLQGNGAAAEAQQIAPGLARLGLTHKVRFADGHFSTTSLSQGQRKRLALLQAWLQDRAIYLLDEWAADQDPAARDDFYRQILPRMQAEGKTLVVISHDDRYFDLADRVVKFEAGQIVSISENPLHRLGQPNMQAASAPLAAAA